jgi:hypothetical protein
MLLYVKKEKLSRFSICGHGNKTQKHSPATNFSATTRKTSQSYPDNLDVIAITLRKKKGEIQSYPFQLCYKSHEEKSKYTPKTKNRDFTKQSTEICNVFTIVFVPVTTH